MKSSVIMHGVSLFKYSWSTDHETSKHYNWNCVAENIQCSIDTSPSNGDLILYITHNDHTIESLNLSDKQKQSTNAKSAANAHGISLLEHQLPLMAVFRSESLTIAVKYNLDNSMVRRFQMKFYTLVEFEQVMDVLRVLRCDLSEHKPVNSGFTRVPTGRTIRQTTTPSLTKIKQTPKTITKSVSSSRSTAKKKNNSNAILSPPIATNISRENQTVQSFLTKDDQPPLVGQATRMPILNNQFTGLAPSNQACLTNYHMPTLKEHQDTINHNLSRVPLSPQYTCSNELRNDIDLGDPPIRELPFPRLNIRTTSTITPVSVGNIQNITASNTASDMDNRPVLSDTTLKVINEIPSHVKDLGVIHNNADNYVVEQALIQCIKNPNFGQICEDISMTSTFAKFNFP